ncbi:hypothetical protein [Actinocorallia aurantiaca]|uniref:Uncharacterized protein n=1 Tax=Actinocorallia aurantiaca TaxID=46204 RepID=A0ABN3UTE0_9ACTN
MFASILVSTDDAVRRGLLAVGDGALSRLIGRPTTPTADSIADGLKNAG